MYVIFGILFVNGVIWLGKFDESSFGRETALPAGPKRRFIARTVLSLGCAFGGVVAAIPANLKGRLILFATLEAKPSGRSSVACCCGLNEFERFGPVVLVI